LLESAGFVGVGEAEAAGAASGGGNGTDGFGMSVLASVDEVAGRKSLIGIAPWYVRTE
jgi:hypothetical protein